MRRTPPTLLALTAALAATAAGCDRGGEPAAPASAEVVGLEIGMTAPDFRLPRLDGQGEARLSELRGKVVLLTFWASWCDPCRSEIPALETLWSRHRDQGFTVLGVSIDQRRADAIGFLSSLGTGVTYPMVLDSSNDVADRYAVASIPLSLLLDRQGRIRGRHMGFRPGALGSLEAEIKRLLSE